MNKENNRSAAALRRSAILERIRLRKEWSALKEIDTENTEPMRKPIRNTQKKNASLKHGQQIKKSEVRKRVLRGNKSTSNNMPINSSSDVLRGVVALVDIGNECRALPLRAALTALGATVVPKWSPLVTHLVWSQGGCQAVRAKARALAACLVSPLWVEACAASNRKLPTNAFPTAARPSDLPSPRTLTYLLKKADMENIPIMDLLSDSKEETEQRMMRLRISSETEQDTSADKTNTSKDKGHETSNDNIDPERRVNTAPRRALPKSTISISPRPEKKSRRKLFTQKEVNGSRRSSDENSEVCHRKPATKSQLSQRDRRALIQAERIARNLLEKGNAHPHVRCTQNKSDRVRIVLTGMNHLERRTVVEAIRSMNGCIQKKINKRTTHVLLGSCKEQADANDSQALSQLDSSFRVVHRSEVQQARTLNALCGAARGCLVLTAQWAIDSATQKRWLHHIGYQVPHLKKISQKARIERIALGYQHADYAYNVFQGMRVYVSPNAEHKDAAIQLLTLCGAVVQDGDRTQNGGAIQNGGTQTADFDIKIGVDNSEVISKWVFDSVAAARRRTARRYVVNEVSNRAS